MQKGKPAFGVNDYASSGDLHVRKPSPQKVVVKYGKAGKKKKK